MTSIQVGCLWDITKIEISLFDPYYLICNQNKLKFTVQLHDHELFNMQMNLRSFSVKFFIRWFIVIMQIKLMFWLTC